MHARIRSRGNFLLYGLALTLFLVDCGGGGGDPAPPQSMPLKLQRIDSSSLTFDFPVFLTAPPGDTGRLFVVEKGGRIKVIAFRRGITAADMLRELLEREYPEGAS